MKDAKVTIGFWSYLMSDAVLFAALFATFAVLRADSGELFSLPFVLLETIILLTSSFFAGLSLLSRDRLKISLALGATLILGILFLGLEVYEFRLLIFEGHGPSLNAFLSSFFTLVGTHGAHVAVGCLWLVVMLAHLWKRGVSSTFETRLWCFVLFWHFLDIVWIFIFTFVYLFGML